MADNDKLPNEMDAEAPADAAGQPAPGEKEDKKAPKKARAPGGAAKIAALEEKLSGAQAEAARVSDQLLRTAAEYDNYRRRSQKEHETAFGNGVGYAVNELLPVLDTLDAAANAETADADYKKGVLLTLQKCEEIFKKLGITEIEALGQPFDPELHNACMQDPGDAEESGIVTRVVQKGYMYKGRVIRHSMVAVSP